MPRCDPPSVCPGKPVIVTVPADTSLFRIHSKAFKATAFNPTISNHPLKGGRFDSNDGRYAYLYAGEDMETAIAEMLVRDIPSGPTPPRIIPLASVKDRMLSEVRVRREILVVSLHGANLGQLGQDAWLTKCAASEYEITRKWANAIRDWAPTAQGMVWRSCRDEDRFAYVLFEDRIAATDVTEVSSIPADTGLGLGSVRRALQRHNVAIA